MMILDKQLVSCRGPESASKDMGGEYMSANLKILNMKGILVPRSVCGHRCALIVKGGHAVGENSMVWVTIMRRERLRFIRNRLAPEVEGWMMILK